MPPVTARGTARLRTVRWGWTMVDGWMDVSFMLPKCSGIVQTKNNILFFVILHFWFPGTRLLFKHYQNARSAYSTLWHFCNVYFKNIFYFTEVWVFDILSDTPFAIFLFVVVALLLFFYSCVFILVIYIFVLLMFFYLSFILSFFLDEGNCGTQFPPGDQ